MTNVIQSLKKIINSLPSNRTLPSDSGTGQLAGYAISTYITSTTISKIQDPTLRETLAQENNICFTNMILTYYNCDPATNFTTLTSASSEIFNLLGINPNVTGYSLYANKNICEVDYDFFGLQENFPSSLEELNRAEEYFTNCNLEVQSSVQTVLLAQMAGGCKCDTVIDVDA